MLKFTEESHPDFENIKTVLHMFEQINNENNQKMIEYEYSLVVEEYAKKFPKLDIITTVGRKFLFEENLNLIEGAKTI